MGLPLRPVCSSPTREKPALTGKEYLRALAEWECQTIRSHTTRQRRFKIGIMANFGKFTIDIYIDRRSDHRLGPMKRTEVPDDAKAYYAMGDLLVANQYDDEMGQLRLSRYIVVTEILPRGGCGEVFIVWNPSPIPNTVHPLNEERDPVEYPPKPVDGCIGSGVYKARIAPSVAALIDESDLDLADIEYSPMEFYEDQGGLIPQMFWMRRKK